MVSPSPGKYHPNYLLAISPWKIVSRHHIIAAIKRHCDKNKSAGFIGNQPRLINERCQSGQLVQALLAGWARVGALNHCAAPSTTADSQRPSLSLACPWLVAFRQSAYVVGLGAASVPGLAPAACVAALFALAALP
jgi:uncharacterized protein affecting Mg2+/Co2+ transport